MQQFRCYFVISINFLVFKILSLYFSFHTFIHFFKFQGWHESWRYCQVNLNFHYTLSHADFILTEKTNNYNDYMWRMDRVYLSKELLTEDYCTNTFYIGIYWITKKEHVSFLSWTMSNICDCRPWWRSQALYYGVGQGDRWDDHGCWAEVGIYIILSILKHLQHQIWKKESCNIERERNEREIKANRYKSKPNQDGQPGWYRRQWATKLRSRGGWQSGGNEVPSRFLKRSKNIEFLCSRMMEEVLGKLSTLEVDMKGVQVKARFPFYKWV